MRGNLPGPCSRCPHVGAIAGRGLCGTCYGRAIRNDDLPDPKFLPYPDLLEEYHHLKGLGFSLETAASRLRVSTRTLYRATKATNDPRSLT
jgi:hypothetical protein